MRLWFQVVTFGMLVVVSAACGGAAPPPPATSESPAAAPAPAAQGAILSDLLKDWQEQKDSLMKLADAMPEDKFGYKSTPAQRSYGEHIMHAALVNVDLLRLVGGKATAPTFTAESVKTKTEIVAALAASYDYGTALLQEQTEATVGQTQDASWLGQSTRARMFWTLLSHSMDVYGQMVVYLRLNGIVPPASRGA
jgi:uncharacterized damage-inducible protein DinB